MADKKISALTPATTPLAGSEVLPVVQSGATVKVSVANLTDGRAVECLSLTSGGVVESTLGGFRFPDGTTQTTAATSGGSGTVTSVSGTGTVNGLTLTGTVTSSGNITLGGTLSGIANSSLANSSITINGTTTALGGSISVGTVTSVGGTGSVNGLTLTGTITGSGNLTLGGTLTGVSLTSAVTGTLPIANGGTGQITASAAFNALSPITAVGDLILGNGTNSATRLAIGPNTYVLTSNGTTASWQPAGGGGGGTGTVTSVSGTGTVNGLTLTGTVTTSGSLTLGGTLSGVSLTTQVSDTLPIANGGTNATTAAGALTSLGAYPASNPSGYTSNTGTVTSVSGTGTVNGLTLTGSITTSGNLTLGGTLSGVSLTTAVSGTLPIANGGTNATTAPDARTNLGLGSAAVLTAGAAGGVATLDGGGTVPTSQLPAAVLGAVKYQGTWNASTNTPTLASGVGTQGYYYVVSVAGSTNLDGISSWAVGDWAIYSGTAWQKIDNTDAVASVNGYTGTVVLTATDVGAASTSGSYANPTWITSLAASKITGTLGVANGGSGATSLSGVLIGNGTSAFTTVTAPSGTIVGTTDTQNLTNKTLTTGNTLDAGTSVSDTGTIAAASPGFRGIPQNAQTSAYTLALTDAGKHISITTGGVIIPANGSIAFPVGTTIVIYNNSSSSQTVSITTDTLRQAGSTNTGSRTLAGYGLATVVKVASTTWVISGAGVS